MINEFKMTIATLQDQSAKLRKELEKLREQKDKERGKEPERAHTSEPRVTFPLLIAHLFPPVLLNAPVRFLSGA